LSGDQKALLRLLAQREQGYEDIASLMGLSVEEVRARVKDALDAVEREGGEVPPAPKEPAEEKPTEKASPAPKKPSKAPTPKSPGSLSKERRVYAIAGGLGLIVIVIVLLATGAIGGGDSGSDSGSNADSGTETAQNTSNEGNSTADALVDSKLTGAILEPADGGDAEGAALFGKAKNQVLLQVEATGLDPSPQGSTYTVWLYKSPQLALRVGAVEVDENGGIRVQLPIPNELLGTVAGGVFDQVAISLTSTAAYKAAVAKARKAGDIPAYTGTAVLLGKLQGPLTEAPADSGK
jgi:hypothetical protein